MNIERLKHHYEILRNELKISNRKLESKCEALAILSKNLEECRRERDQLKLFLEQMQARHQFRKHTLPNFSTEKGLSKQRMTGGKTNQDSSMIYKYEIEELKQKLKEALEDTKLLREQLTRHRIGSNDEALDPRYFPAHERQDLVTSLECNQTKISQLERDLQQVLDEKEELVSERNVYKEKYDRLNEHLNRLMGSSDSTVLDIDAVLAESRYLQEKIKQVEDEKAVAMAAVAKYKMIMEKTRNKSLMKFGQPRLNGIVITQKQVQQVLYSENILQNTPQTLQDLRSLCGALIDSINDKKVALQHQKKTNRILGERVTELEAKFKKLKLENHLAPSTGAEEIPDLNRTNWEIPELRKAGRKNPGADKIPHIFDVVDSIEEGALQNLLAPKTLEYSSPARSLPDSINRRDSVIPDSINSRQSPAADRLPVSTKEKLIGDDNDSPLADFLGGSDANKRDAVYTAYGTNGGTSVNTANGINAGTALKNSTNGGFGFSQNTVNNCAENGTTNASNSSVPSSPGTAYRDSGTDNNGTGAQGTDSDLAVVFAMDGGIL